MAMDDDLRDKATECIRMNFSTVLETREFHILPSIKLELVGTKKKMLMTVLSSLSNRSNNTELGNYV